MRSGIVAVIGRPNVGKSSLVNALVGTKVSIVSHKPQTTRHRIQGVLHLDDGQIVFVDTPGLHRAEKKALNRVMNKAATGAISDVDLVLFVVEANRWTDEDQAVFERLAKAPMPVALIINKVDRMTDKARLLPLIEKYSKLREWAVIVPVSAWKRTNLDNLTQTILARLPEGPPLYPEDMVTGYDNAFAAAELVREKIVRNLHQELPYTTAVEIENYKRDGKIDRIDAVIWVEREGQKKIVIGKDGAALKNIGSAARRELEKILGRKIMLRLWCKVRENWSDDMVALKRFGLTPE